MPHVPWDRFGHADEAIDCLFPLNGRGKISLIRCSIDASTSGGGIFTVAAVGFEQGPAKRANRAWNTALGDRSFHMTDLNARRGEFEGVSDDEVKQIMISTVGAVCQYASFAVAVSCDFEDVKEHLPFQASRDATSAELLSAFRSHYGVICHLCMSTVGHMAGGGRDVDYTLERGDDGQKGLIRYLDFVESNEVGEQMCNLYSLRRKSVGTKDNIEGVFNSADLVAWEWGKNVSRQAAGKPKRKSLETLEKRTPHHFKHFGKGELTDMLKTFRLMLDAKSQEDIANAMQYWRQREIV